MERGGKDGEILSGGICIGNGDAIRNPCLQVHLNREKGKKLISEKARKAWKWLHINSNCMIIFIF